jgi:DNA-binding MarR family transcriptional regulator
VQKNVIEVGVENPLADNFVAYVSEMAGQSVVWSPSASERLPQYLAQQYELCQIKIGGRQFLGILIKDPDEFRPSAFTKHLRQIISTRSSFEGYCLIAQDLPGYVRHRLVDRKIPFVVPGRQLYWPELGLVVQARKSKTVSLPTETFSPGTQTVLIYALCREDQGPVTPKMLSEELGYTAMTMSRALDEIENNELGQVVRFGRERLLVFLKEKDVLWQAALRYLRNPVRETVRVKENQLPLDLRLKAGETALATMSMLVPPKEPIYAMGREAWKTLGGEVKLIPVEDEDTCRIQLWRYDPALFAFDGRVDRFSLFLSLRDEEDERVQTALEEMMENTEWS